MVNRSTSIAMGMGGAGGSGGGSAPVSPIDYFGADLVAWNSMFTLPNFAVTNWPDESGNGRVLNDGGGLPSLITGPVAGGQATRINAVDQRLNGSMTVVRPYGIAFWFRVGPQDPETPVRPPDTYGYFGTPPNIIFKTSGAVWSPGGDSAAGQWSLDAWHRVICIASATASESGIWLDGTKLAGDKATASDHSAVSWNAGYRASGTHDSDYTERIVWNNAAADQVATVDSMLTNPTDPT